MSEIVVYNTLSGKKEPLIPKEPGKIGMYCCGPTTYNFIHLGNARPLVVFDTIRRYLAYKGYAVTYIQNFTDVDDKIIKRANEEGQLPQELANHYIEEYFKDADALNVMRATVHPTVSGHMQDIIDFVKALVDKGVAYELDGDVYYSVSEFKEYGKLSKRNREDLLDGARVGVDERKRDAADFALWKKAKPGEPFWESPWGKGRPGWHIECSTMSHKYLGESFDIHGGGFDLIFPHHENEIAQSEGRFNKPMARYWIHNGFITVNQEKMSKSLGNFFLVREILAKYPAQVVRFYLLSVHYRSQLDFDDEKLDVAIKGLERLKTAVRLTEEALGQLKGQSAASSQSSSAAQGSVQNPAQGQDSDQELKQAVQQLKKELMQFKNQFETAMDDDFNTALAIAVLFDTARVLNSFVSSYGQNNYSQSNAALVGEALSAGLEQLLSLAGVLGLELTSKAQEEDPQLKAGLVQLLESMGAAEDAAETQSADTAALMDNLLQLRQKARQAKDFAKADKVRDGLKALNILIEDTNQGPRWYRG